jgi:hypothetical protein
MMTLASATNTSECGIVDFLTVNDLIDDAG